MNKEKIASGSDGTHGIDSVGSMDTVSSTDTVSDSGEGRSITPPLKEARQVFEYKHFCRTIMKRSKKWMAANFLVPLKMLKEHEEVQDENSWESLEKWMDAFKEKEGSVDSFWTYMVYLNGYNRFREHSEKSGDDKLKESIVDCASESAKTCMNEISKLENARYIAQQCEKGDICEYWILSVYEMTLKKLYTPKKLAFIIQDIVAYLKLCGLKIDMPMLAENNQDKDVMYPVMSKLMLLVVRLHLNKDTDKALRKYKSGNAAYSGYRDQMLTEYIRLSGMFFYQSYERFIKMMDCAMCSRNKYAAKEVGDIYRLGMELQDMHGNVVVIDANMGKACDYYRIRRNGLNGN